MTKLWIVDRRPSKADTDEHGMVATKSGPRAWDSIVWREDDRRASPEWLPLCTEAMSDEDLLAAGLGFPPALLPDKNRLLKAKEREAEALVVKLVETTKGIDTLRGLVKNLSERLDVSTKEIKQRDHQLAEAIKLIDSFQDTKFLHKEEIRKRDNQIAESLVLIADFRVELDKAAEDYRLLCVEEDENAVLLKEANRTIEACLLACRNRGFLSWLLGRLPGCGA